MIRGQNFNSQWEFHLGDLEEAHLPSSPTELWEQVQLPHDFSASFSFNEEEGHGCTAYLLGGVAWYRKKFKTTAEMEGKRVFVCFDGIYERASIYCNGEIIAFHPYGYSPCLLDLTEYLQKKDDESNILAVYVDHSRDLNSRWYTGSGIYRSVTLHILPQVHIPVWGLKLTTPQVTEELATLSCEITLVNSLQKQQMVEILLSCFDPEGNLVLESKEKVLLESGSTEIFHYSYQITKPILWEIHQGKQYKLQVKTKINSEIQQEKEEYFGIHWFYFDKDRGFFLNGTHRWIQGVCLHHDCGALGAAVPLDAWRRRLNLLKNMGCNAIRTAHNPVSEDFLYLCDEMGFLVQEEFFDEWDNPKDKRSNATEKVFDYRSRSYTEFFRNYAKTDLQAVISRDFNHPCIFQWSIGNEIEWCYPKYNKAPGYFSKVSGTELRMLDLPRYSPEEIRENIAKLPKDFYDVGSTAKKLSQWVKELDNSRPIIANLLIPASSYETGYTDALDMVGFSYRGALYPWAKEHYPEKAMMGTENVCQYHEWKSVLDNPHVAGVFLWMGIDHLGEAWVQKGYPRKSSNLGLFDLACHPKPSYYLYKSLWTDQPVIHFETQSLEKSLYQLDSQGKLQEKVPNSWKERRWFWQEVKPYWNDYQEGEDVVVEISSNLPELTLYLNEKQVSTAKLEDFPDSLYRFHLPYETGTLKAVGDFRGETVTASLTTEGLGSDLVISLDKTTLNTDADSLLHVEVQVVDSQGQPVRNTEYRLNIKLNPCGTLLAIDNGCPDCVEDFQNNFSIETWHGKAIFYIKGREEGTLTGTISFTDEGKMLERSFSLPVLQ